MAQTRGDQEWVSLPGLVETAADRFAGREALIDGPLRLTFADLAVQVRRAAAATVAQGVEPGDRVAIWAPNSAGWAVAALGAVGAGAVLVPLNTRFKGAEAAYVLAKAKVKLLLVSGPFLGNDYLDMLERECGGGAESRPLRDLPELRQVVVLDGPAGPPFLTWERFLAAGHAASAAEVDARARALGPGDVCDITFTSGTTGRPKGAVITHGQTLRVFGVWSNVVGLAEGDRYLVVNPFFHTFGYKAGILACLMRGATILPQPVFDPAAVLDRIAADRVSVLPGPPALYAAMLDAPARAGRDLSSLRLAVTGAAVIPLDLVRRIRDDLGFDTVLTAYGLTEATGTATMCRRDDPLETVARTSGRAIPDTEVRVVDAAGQPVPAGQPGEVVVRGYNVMRGYFEDPQATAEAIDTAGWLHTGDVGELDDRGYLRITDRIKDMYVVGGFNAYPAEIEQELGRHAGIAEVAVVGVPDHRLGEVGKAFVVVRPGTELTAAEVIGWSRERMANYKVPRHVEFVDRLPRNASGKVLKYALRSPAPRRVEVT
jgi:acyl-CoA synthetase (AMP-forming)/AMP-acid ligase II